MSSKAWTFFSDFVWPTSVKRSVLEFPQIGFTNRLKCHFLIQLQSHCGEPLVYFLLTKNVDCRTHIQGRSGRRSFSRNKWYLFIVRPHTPIQTGLWRYKTRSTIHLRTFLMNELILCSLPEEPFDEADTNYPGGLNVSSCWLRVVIGIMMSSSLPITEVWGKSLVYPVLCTLYSVWSQSLNIPSTLYSGRKNVCYQNVWVQLYSVLRWRGPVSIMTGWFMGEINPDWE